jgi:hypothetical protein
VALMMMLLPVVAMSVDGGSDDVVQNDHYLTHSNDLSRLIEKNFFASSIIRTIVDNISAC